MSKYRCDHCGEVFEEPHYREVSAEDYYGVGGMFSYSHSMSVCVCPLCGSDVVKEIEEDDEKDYESDEEYYKVQFDGKCPYTGKPCETFSCYECPVKIARLYYPKVSEETFNEIIEACNNVAQALTDAIAAVTEQITKILNSIDWEGLAEAILEAEREVNDEQ